MAGEHYLYRFDDTVRLATAERTDEVARFEGEFQLLIGQSEFGRAQVTLTNFGLVSSGITVRGDHTGHVSVRGSTGIGFLAWNEGRWALGLDFEAEVVYDLIGTRLGYTQMAQDVFVSPVERFHGHIAGFLDPPESFVERQEAPRLRGEISLTYSEGGLGLLMAMRLPLEDASPERLGGGNSAGQGESATRNLSCDPSLQVNWRSLRVQPVGFRASDKDNSPTGVSANRQFKAANAIWGKCCIRLLPLVTLRTLSSDDAIRSNSYADSDETIEVFFVDNALTNNGGGACYGGGKLPAVVISDNVEMIIYWLTS